MALPWTIVATDALRVFRPTSSNWNSTCPNCCCSQRSRAQRVCGKVMPLEELQNAVYFSLWWGQRCPSQMMSVQKILKLKSFPAKRNCISFSIEVTPALDKDTTQGGLVDHRPALPFAIATDQLLLNSVSAMEEVVEGTTTVKAPWTKNAKNTKGNSHE